MAHPTWHCIVQLTVCLRVHQVPRAACILQYWYYLKNLHRDPGQPNGQPCGASAVSGCVWRNVASATILHGLNAPLSSGLVQTAASSSGSRPKVHHKTVCTRGAPRTLAVQRWLQPARTATMLPGHEATIEALFVRVLLPMAACT